VVIVAREVLEVVATEEVEAGLELDDVATADEAGLGLVDAAAEDEEERELEAGAEEVAGRWTA